MNYIKQKEKFQKAANNIDKILRRQKNLMNLFYKQITPNNLSLLFPPSDTHKKKREITEAKETGPFAPTSQ